jgi:hypothetical protein
MVVVFVVDIVVLRGWGFFFVVLLKFIDVDAVIVKGLSTSCGCIKIVQAALVIRGLFICKFAYSHRQNWSIMTIF